MNAQQPLFPGCVWFVLRAGEIVRCPGTRELPSESCAEHLSDVSGIVARVCVVRGCEAPTWLDSVVYCAGHARAEDRPEHERALAASSRRRRAAS